MSLLLNQLVINQPAMVTGLISQGQNDPIARRLDELGFIDGEPVRVLGKGLFGTGPLLIEIGSTRFALRLNEAKRIMVSAG